MTAAGRVGAIDAASSGRASAGSPPDGSSLRVAVVGGGIAGLATAEALLGSAADVTVFEAWGRFGGRIGTRDVRGFVLEAGPDGYFAGTPSVEGLVARLGLADRVVDVEPGWAGIVRDGAIAPLPTRLWNGVPYRAGDVLGCAALRPMERIRLLAEPLVPARAVGGPGTPEDLDAFLVRRLGRGAARRLVGPLLAGVHAGLAAELESVSVAPAMVAAEREHGSILRAARTAARSGTTGGPDGRRRGLRSFRGGMTELIAALVSALEHGGASLLPDARVVAAERDGERWRLRTVDGSAVSFDRVVLATPPSAIASLLEDTAPEVASVAASVATTEARLVHLHSRATLPASYAGLHGAIVPADEPGPISAFSVASTKWPGRAPSGSVLVRASLRPGADPDEAPGAVARLLGVDGRPDVVVVDVIPGAWPVMRVGHATRVAALRDAVSMLPGLSIVGAAWDGVGVGSLVAAGAAIAAEVASRGAEAAGRRNAQRRG